MWTALFSNLVIAAFLNLAALSLIWLSGPIIKKRSVMLRSARPTPEAATLVLKGGRHE